MTAVSAAMAACLVLCLVLELIAAQSLGRRSSTPGGLDPNDAWVPAKRDELNEGTILSAPVGAITSILKTDLARVLDNYELRVLQVIGRSPVQNVIDILDLSRSIWERERGTSLCDRLSPASLLALRLRPPRQAVRLVRQDHGRLSAQAGLQCLRSMLRDMPGPAEGRMTASALERGEAA
jgi:hypothetical protein